MTGDKYARVYYRMADDPKFETVYPDDRLLAAWLRLLLVADASWPTYPPIPRTVRKASLDALVAAQIVDLMPHDCFRIHGLDKERAVRAQKARTAAAQRWQSVSNADALPEQSASNADPMLVRVIVKAESESESEQSRADARATFEEPEGEALTWLARHGCDIRPGNGYHQKLILAVENHGINAVIGMFDRLETAGVKHGDIKGFLFGAIDALNGRPDLKGLEAEERAEERNTALQRSIAATKRRTAELEEWRERPVANGKQT